MSQANSGLQIGIHAGKPLMNHDKLFGETIQFATILGAIAKDGQVSVSAVVKDLAS